MSSGDAKLMRPNRRKVVWATSAAILAAGVGALVAADARAPATGPDDDASLGTGAARAADDAHGRTGAAGPTADAPAGIAAARSASLASVLSAEVPWPQRRPALDIGFDRSRTTTRAQTCPPDFMLETEPSPYREFYFSRGAYSSDPFGRRGNSWSVDFNKADRQFLVVLERILDMDAFECENVVYLDDPHMRKFPWVYMLEVGGMGLTPREVEGLRGYLLAGGFAFIDDFWGTYEWDVFYYNISAVLPEYPIVEMPMDHLIFRIVYPIEEVLQVPNNGQGCRGNPDYYFERDGYEPHLRGIFDDTGRLLVLISWNSDLGDAWEWAEQPCYPWDRSNYAFQLGFNVIVYAMTH